MQHLIRLSMRLGAVVFLLVIVLFGSGVFAAYSVPQDLLPNISLPAFLIITPDNGASPSVVDSEVSIPIGNALSGVVGQTSIDTSSTQGASIAVIQFKDGTDLNGARQNIIAAIDKIKPSLPASSQNPTISSFATGSLPILQYSVSSDQSLGELATKLKNIALPRLKGLSGVNSVNITGAPNQEVQVTLNPSSLAAKGVSSLMVSQTLSNANLTQPLGIVSDNGTYVPIQISLSLTSLDAIKNLVILPGSPPQSINSSGFPGVMIPSLSVVRLSDVAKVELVELPADTITRTNGKESIGLSILKTPDANTVKVANEVKEVLGDIKARMGDGASFRLVVDQATPVTDAIAKILQEGGLGAVFAIFVIFFFLRSGRATLVAGISIPLSLLAALVVLWWQGLTLNILTLGGMMVAVGRVVDDAIVVLENISRHLAEGESPLTAAYTGAKEISTAVTASTLTTVAVFLPIVFLTGIAGSFFRPFALTVVAALLASLIVAIMVVPLLASTLLKNKKNNKDDLDHGFLQNLYVPIIRKATSHRLIALVMAAVIFASSMALVPLVRVNLLDQSQSPSFTVAITLPEKTTLSTANAEVIKLETLVGSVKGISSYVATVGGGTNPFVPLGSLPANPTVAEIIVIVEKGQYDSAMSGVKAALKGYSGPAKAEAGATGSNASSSTSGVSIQVIAPNQASLEKANTQVLAALKKVEGVGDLKSNLSNSSPQYQVTPTDKLSASGLSPQILAGMIASQINGMVVTNVQLSEGKVSVHIVQPAGNNSINSIKALMVPTSGGLVRLDSLANVSLVEGPVTINRSSGERTATISGVITGNDTRAVQAKVDKALKDTKLSDGAKTSTGGVFSQLNDLLSQFVLAIIAAIALVYIIMVATFRSLLKPLVLLVAVPFAATGAIVALIVSHTSLSLPGMIGLLMLIGIVVTNAIVLLDLVEQYRERGMDLQTALIEGGRHRLRPILMTALATMLALVPLAFSDTSSGGGFISAPLAVVVIGGLFTSTILTLIIVPVLYSVVDPWTSKHNKKAFDTELNKAEQRRFGDLESTGK